MSVEELLTSIIIPEIDFQGVKPHDAIEWLRQESGQRVAIVLVAPLELIFKPCLNMRFADICLLHALGHVAAQTRLYQYILNSGVVLCPGSVLTAISEAVGNPNTLPVVYVPFMDSPSGAQLN